MIATSTVKGGPVFPDAFLKPRRSVLAVERQAATTLERCRKKMGLDEIPLPVPVESFIEVALRIRFSVMDLSHLGPGVLGGAFLKKREIVIDQSLVNQLGRYRFTCAHELGHIVLHRKHAAAFEETTASGAATAPTTNKLEWQADRFAAAFLMPADLLIGALFEVCDLHTLNHRRCVTELMMGTPESEWLWRYRFLPHLTRQFEVSLSAMLHRFGDFRLPDGKPFLLPSRLERLLLKAEDGDAVRGFFLKDGFPEAQPRLFVAE